MGAAVPPLRPEPEPASSPHPSAAGAVTPPTGSHVPFSLAGPSGVCAAGLGWGQPGAAHPATVSLVLEIAAPEALSSGANDRNTRRQTELCRRFPSLFFQSAC